MTPDESARERAQHAEARAQQARERATAARAHAERDAARGLGEHAAMHVREAELHDLAAEHQADAARTQHQHADEHP